MFLEIADMKKPARLQGNGQNGKFAYWLSTIFLGQLILQMNDFSALHFFNNLNAVEETLLPPQG